MRVYISYYKKWKVFSDENEKKDFIQRHLKDTVKLV